MLDFAVSAPDGAPLTLEQYQARFPDDEACLKAIMVESFGGTEIRCPGCQESTRFHPMRRRRAYACQGCGHQIYPCAGTVLRRTRTPLTSWFLAMHILGSAREAISAAELERQVGCSYKTALRIAKAFQQGGRNPKVRSISTGRPEDSALSIPV